MNDKEQKLLFQVTMSCLPTENDKVGCDGLYYKSIKRIQWTDAKDGLPTCDENEIGQKHSEPCFAKDDNNCGTDMIITNETLKRVIQLTICYAIAEAHGDIADDGMKPLALARIQNEAQKWLKSDECRDMCECVGIDWHKLAIDISN